MREVGARLRARGETFALWDVGSGVGAELEDAGVVPGARPGAVRRSDLGGRGLMVVLLLDVRGGPRVGVSPVVPAGAPSARKPRQSCTRRAGSCGLRCRFSSLQRGSVLNRSLSHPFLTLITAKNLEAMKMGPIFAP